MSFLLPTWTPTRVRDSSCLFVVSLDSDDFHVLYAQVLMSTKIGLVVCTLDLIDDPCNDVLHPEGQVRCLLIMI